MLKWKLNIPAGFTILRAQQKQGMQYVTCNMYAYKSCSCAPCNSNNRAIVLKLTGVVKMFGFIPRAKLKLVT